jgi:hypothetical protein
MFSITTDQFLNNLPPAPEGFAEKWRKKMIEVDLMRKKRKNDEH